MNRYQPARSEPPKITTMRIPRGFPGTQHTAAHVRRLILDGAKDFYVRQKAIDIMLGRAVRPKNYRGEIQALFEWVQRNVRYTKDPFRVEVLHSPRRLLELRAGDCDDMTILLGAMLEAIGHPVRLVLTGPDPARPLLFSHIYLEVNYRGRWIPLDATMPHPMGWAPHALVRRTVPLREGEPYAIHGNAGAGDAGAAGPAEEARMAPPVAARHRRGRGAAQGSTGQATVGLAQAAGPAGAEPVAQGPAPLHLGDRARRAAAAEDRQPDQGAAPPVGSPAAPDRDGTGSGPLSGDAGADRPDDGGAASATAGAVSALDAAPAGSPGAPGATPAGGPGPADGAGVPGALNGYLRQGAGLYRGFHQFDPEHTVRVAHHRVMPPVVVQVGDLIGLMYRSDKWQRGRPRTYIHRLTSPPRLVSNVDGTQLYLVGGSYRITPRGVEG